MSNGNIPRNDRMPKKYRGLNGNGNAHDLDRCQHRTRMKKTYRSKAKAKQAAITFTAHSGVRTYPYLCRKCGNWHLTHLEQRAA